MLKASLFFALVLVCCCAKGQSDSLRKYSYRLWGFGDSSIAFGTGCFIRVDTSLYLLTAKHVLSGCVIRNGRAAKDSNYPKVIVAYANDTSFIGNIVIRTEKIKDTSKCLPFSSYPDIICVSVTNARQMKVNSLELFDEASITNEGEVSIYGYPFATNFNRLRLNVSQAADSLIWGKDEYVVEGDGGINNVFASKKVGISTDSLPGFSGSPVFFRQPSEDRWKIVGVVAGFSKSKSGMVYFFIPRIELVTRVFK